MTNFHHSHVVPTAQSFYKEDMAVLLLLMVVAAAKASRCRTSQESLSQGGHGSDSLGQSFSGGRVTEAIVMVFSGLLTLTPLSNILLSNSVREFLEGR